MQRFLKHSPVVVDANIAVWAIVPTSLSRPAIALFSGWRHNKLKLHAPALWLPECTSAIRRHVHAGKLSLQGGNEALSSLFELEVQIVEANQIRCQNALQWADRLGRSKAYDGFYLALAEELDAQFYTADRRLANNAHQAGAGWVHLLSETEDD